MLTAQLNEVNTSFKSALETAAELLTALSKPRRRRGPGAEESVPLSGAAASASTETSAGTVPPAAVSPATAAPPSAQGAGVDATGAETTSAVASTDATSLAARNGGEPAEPTGPAPDAVEAKAQRLDDAGAPSGASRSVTSPAADGRRRK